MPLKEEHLNIFLFVHRWMEQASPPRGCVIQSPLYWLILRVCGILLLILYLFWLLFSKYRQLVKSLRVPFKMGGIFGKIPLSLRNAHSYLSPRHNLYLLQLSHLFRIFYQDLPFSPPRPVVSSANICSVIPRHFLSGSNQKSCERPSLQLNEAHEDVSTWNLDEGWCCLSTKEKHFNSCQ